MFNKLLYMKNIANNLKTRIFAAAAVLILVFFGVQYLDAPGQLTGSLQVGRHTVSFPETFTNSDAEIDLGIRLVGRVPDKFKLKFVDFYPDQQMRVVPVLNSRSDARGVRTQSNVMKYKITNFDATQIDDAIKFKIISNKPSFFPEQVVKIQKIKSKPLISRLNFKSANNAPDLAGIDLDTEQNSIFPSSYDVNIKFSLLQDYRYFLKFHNGNPDEDEVAAEFSYRFSADGYIISVIDNTSPDQATEYNWSQVGDFVEIVTDAKTYYVVLEHVRSVDRAPLFSLYSEGDAYIKIAKDNEYLLEFWDESLIYFGSENFAHNSFILKGYNSEENLLEFSKFRGVGFSIVDLNDHLLQDPQGYLHMRTHGGMEPNDTQDYLIKSLGSQDDNLNVAIKSVDPESVNVKVGLRWSRLDRPNLIAAPNRINFITRDYSFANVCALYLNSVDNQIANIKSGLSGCSVDRDGVNISLGERVKVVSGTDDIFITVAAVTDDFVDVIFERVGSNYVDLVQETVYENVIYTFFGEGYEVGAELAPATFDPSYIYVNDSNFIQEFIEFNQGDTFTLSPSNNGFLYDLIRMEDKDVGGRIKNVYRVRNTDFEQEFYRNAPTVSFERNSNAYLRYEESVNLGTLQFSKSTPLSYFKNFNFELSGCNYGVESVIFREVHANGEAVGSDIVVSSETELYQLVLDRYNTSEQLYELIINQDVGYVETKDYCLQSNFSPLMDLGLVLESLVYSNHEVSEDEVVKDLNQRRYIYFASEIL